MTDDDKRAERDTRWFRTIDSNRHHLDGNPAHPKNGGLSGLALQHCLASIANHSCDDNAEFENVNNFVTPRAYLELHKMGDATPDTALYACCILRAIADIYPGQQILVDYQPKTSAKLPIVFGNETLVRFLQDTAAVLRGERSWFKLQIED